MWREESADGGSADGANVGIDILVRGVQIVSPGDGRPLVVPKGDVAVVGSEIAYAGPSPAPEGFGRARRVIDGSGLVALPGLVNAHTHAAMTVFRGFADDMPLMEWLTRKIWPAEARLEAKDVYWGTMLACVEMIRAGVTTFADMYFFMDETAKAVEKTGMRASLSRGLIGSAPGADKALAEGRELCERWNGACGGRITTMLGPHAPYTCPKDFLERVMEASSELRVGMHIHLSETEGEVRECKALHGGLSPVELMDSYGLFEFPVLAAHCVHVSERDIEILSEKGVGVAHNPGCNMKIASGIAPVPRMLQAGVKVGLGTDGAASNNNLDLLEETRIAAFLHKLASNDPTVLAAPEALCLATLGSARAIGLEARIGTLEAGKKADIVLMDATGPHMHPHHDIVSHIVYSARSSDVRTVIIDGNVVMEDGVLTHVDEKEVLARAEERARALVCV
ncbi:MAG: amidohydrolase [Firmicutes bacterium]|nr:amidohydrolase [Bacillota bacterium]MDH7494603.1 amidohydrolase [Bacillota bacterium]